MASKDLIGGKRLVCINCQGVMELNERLSNGKRKGGSYRRRLFECNDCHDYREVIYAEGGKDLDDDAFQKESKLENDNYEE